MLKRTALCVLMATTLAACGAPPADPDASALDARSNDSAVMSMDVAGSDATSLDVAALDRAALDSGAVATMDVATVVDSGVRDSGAPRPDATPAGDPALPAMPAACPTITPNADATFEIAGGPVRAYFRYDAARINADSALVIAWEQSGGMGGLSATNYAAAGMRPNDILVGPYKSGQFYSRVTETGDAIVACAAAQLRFNRRRIGTVGFSAGANAAWELVSRRNAYVAAAALFSAGTSGSAPLMGNRYALMVGFGSMTADTPFYGLTVGIRDTHVGRGFPVISCAHGMGHRFPYGLGTAVGRFFVEHSWGTRPTPWTVAPVGDPAVPAYCTVTAPG
jgi:hypothetical protein